MNSRTVRRPSIVSGGNEQRRHRPDYWLIILPALLLVIGLIVVYAISPGLSVQRHVNENYFITKQLVAIVLGIGVFIFTSLVPTNSWRKYQKHLIILSVISCVALLIFGEKVNGAYRWIQVGGLSFQAVELVKFTILIWLSAFVADQIRTGQLNDFKKTFKPILILLGIVALVVANPKLQSDLGSTGVIVAMVGSICFIARLPMKRFLSIGLIVLIGTILLVASSSYRRDRLQTYLQPERDCQNSGYQACQALIAVGSGGMFGKGLAHSVQAYGYLPEAANDSIFAIYAEKFGFVGVSLLLLIFGVFYTRLKLVMERAPNAYSRFLVVGVLAWLSTQTLINIGAMIGLLPLKGITLPFISYGGTSIIFVMAALGVVFNISRYTTYSANTSLDNEGEGHDDSTDRRGHRRSYNTYSGSRSRA